MQLNEMNGGRGEQDWAMKYQLLPDLFLNKLPLIATRELDYERVQKYELNEIGLPINLQWLPNLKWVKSDQAKVNHHCTRWELQRLVTEVEKVTQAFRSRDQ